MRVYLSDKELAEITVKQGKDAHMFEYYIGSIKIGVLDERVMQNNILMLDAVKDKYVAEEIEKAIDSMPRENILQEIQEDKDIEDYILLDDVVFPDFDDELLNHLIKAHETPSVQCSVGFNLLFLLFFFRKNRSCFYHCSCKRIFCIFPRFISIFMVKFVDKPFNLITDTLHVFKI